METINVKLTGTRPLLMHADVFADPLNPLTKAHKVLTSKRKKSDDDQVSIAKSEWRGGLYFDDELGPYVPGVNIEACMLAGAKLSKLGTQFKRSVEVTDLHCALKYVGPRTVEQLWAKQFYDARSVKVQTARITRYRPIFKAWSVECQIAYDEQTIDRAQVLKCLADGGLYCGIGDFRPKFGRFTVEVLK